MTQLELIPHSSSDSSKKRKQLLKALRKKRSILKRLILKNEALKVKLDILKREYMVKIGSLVVRDNHLDLDLIRLRNMIKLMEEGKSEKEAEEELRNTFYAEQLEIGKEEENIRRAEKILEKARRKKSVSLEKQLKTLWRKLIAQFHPDLTQDEKEKTRREEIMKQINLAYEEGDFAKLSGIERDHTVLEVTPTEDIEELLVKIENDIIDQKKQFSDLTQSEWYKWHLKISNSEKTVEDIFSGVEKKLIDDILTKIKIVKDLNEQIEVLTQKKTI